MRGLCAEGVSFSYGSRQIFNQIDVGPISRGELTVLIGPNASGKSTLFRLIAGLLQNSSGKVVLEGQNLAALSLKERLNRVCFMPQFFTANAALTVFDVVMMAHKQLKGWRVTEADMVVVGNVLETAGIGHLAEAYVSELSGGQSQMVSVAQALVRSSDVYLFDEPTSALDLRHQLDVLDQIRSAIVGRNAIGVVALHDLNLAARFADRLILLGDGQIRAQGHPIDVLSKPEIAETYGVYLETAAGPRDEIVVHAYTS
ncbi:ATP-binding protein Irp6C [Roseibium sp. TrichSKD4]|uniref:ABC transporter ATP-binding protein n=1 Tax=Roseibium sp. TrichSKD4 TaxID=744980 RepID=UPI0001E569FA|nr:ABC transporter ATP-binding protein [Roseibium sp. TrichSKD4]EFO31880.1 ATP-binding protein Irp6C [Roseibium sp. TrichSKD4]